MNLKIAFIGRAEALKFIEDDENLEDGKVDFISVSDTNKEKEHMHNVWKITKGPMSAAIFLNFADTEDEYSSGLTDAKVDKIIEFLAETKKQNKMLLVHCFAGISRSAAIAKYYRDFYNIDCQQLVGYEMHNRMVYNALMERSGITTLRSHYRSLEVK